MPDQKRPAPPGWTPERLRPLSADHVVWLAAGISLLIFVFTFSIAPLIGEDYALTRDFGNADLGGRLAWVLARSHQQISTWNARLGEQLAIFWLAMPKVWFTLFTTATFLTFSYLVATLFGPPHGARRRMLLGVAFAFAMWPGLEVFFWGTGTAEYLQPLIPCLFCLRSYASVRNLTSVESSWWRSIGLTLVAILGGISFENIPVAVVAYMIFSIVVRRRERVTLRTILPIIGMSLAWILLITAPSTGVRRAVYKQMYGPKEYSLDYLVGRGMDVLTIFTDTSWLIAALALLAAVVVWRFSIDRTRFVGLVMVAVLIVGSVVAAPYTEPRAFNLAWAIMFATILCAAEALFERQKAIRVLVAAASIACLYFGLTTANYYADFAQLSNERHYFIEAQTHTPECKTGIQVTAVDNPYPYRYINNRNDWYRANPALVGAYYGCKVIVK